MTGTPTLDRRALFAAGAVALTGSLWGGSVLAEVRRGDGPYGELQDADAHGVRLPRGFRSRVLARSGEVVPGTSQVWHGAPDGGAVFPSGTGWVYVSNSELPTGGGASMLRFDAAGEVVDARRVLSGTRSNCAGGAMPWGTWLSCEETARGYVYECDPAGARPAVRRPGMGRFVHEAAAADLQHRLVYLTEDERDGCFYRFRPVRWGDLSRGRLQVLCRVRGALAWKDVPDPSATRVPTRHQVREALHFDGGEGCWYGGGSVFFTTKGDNRVWQYLSAASPARLGVLYDAGRSGGPLSGVDNVTGSPASGQRDLFVAEDGGNLEICVLTQDRGAAAFLRLVGHDLSELTGPAFSPDGSRLYFSSQRGTSGRSSGGVTFEVRGPFR